MKKGKFFTKELIIGASVILALAILFFGIDYLKGINLFKPVNFYYVNYDRVDGLEVAAPVTIDGYKVGQVREIEFNYDKPGKIKVLLALDPKLHLPQGSRAIIAQSLLSGASIQLVLGTSKAMIPVGGEVTSHSEPDLMAAVSDQILPSVTGILPKVDTLLANLNMLTSHPAIYRSLGRIERVTDNLYTGTSMLNGTLGKVDGYLSAYTPGLFNRVNNIATNLDTITTDLTMLSGNLRDLPLEQSVNNINELTARLISFSEALNNEKSTLGMLLNDPQLYNNLCKVSASVDSLILDIKKNPKRYISIKLL